MIDVSVIIPTYNRCNTLKRAVRSVLNQTYPHYELIIINNGSTDDTKKFLASFQIPRLSHVNLTSNFGANVARNEGIKRSRGEFVAFLDDDDCFAPAKLKCMLSAMKARNRDLGYSGKNIVAGDNRFLKVSYKKPRYKCPVKSIMTDNFIGVTSAVIVRKALLESVNGFSPDLAALQDYDLYIRLIKAGATLYGTPEPLIDYHREEDEERKISCSYIRFRQARKHLLEKYALDEYYSVLQRALFIIGIKKAFKSKQFVKGIFRSKASA